MVVGGHLVDRRRRGTTVGAGSTAVHSLFLEDGQLGFQEAVFTAELGDLGGGAGGVGDLAHLDGGFETVKSLITHVEVVLQGLEILGKVSLDASDARSEAVDESFDRFHGEEEILAEAWQHA